MTFGRTSVERANTVRGAFDRSGSKLNRLDEFDDDVSERLERTPFGIVDVAAVRCPGFSNGMVVSQVTVELLPIEAAIGIETTVDAEC